MSEDTPIPGPLNNVIRIDDERCQGYMARTRQREDASLDNVAVGGERTGVTLGGPGLGV